MKNKIVSVILVALMLIPSVIAIVNYNSQQNGKADSHNTLSVTLTDANGLVYTFNNDDNNREIFDYFMKLAETSEPVESLPTTVEMADFYQATFATAVKEFGYKFYFTGSTADCYFVDGDGAAYRISEEDAKYFLSSPYSGSLYENGEIPLMTVSGNPVKPEKAQWTFTDYAGSKIKAETSPVISSEKQTVSAQGGLSMTFPVEPDSFTVVITSSDGTEIFNDTYDKIGNAAIKDGTVNIEASVKWFEDETRAYSGEETYKFTASVTEPAQFYAGVTDIQIGEFISVTGVNVGNKDDVKFTSEPDIAYTPVFFEDGEYVRTLIPFNWNLSAGDYVLSFEYGGSSQKINIKLSTRDNPFREATTSIADAVVNANGSAEAKSKCEEEMRAVAKSAEQAGAKYFDGEFLTGVDDGTITGGFGHTYTVAGTNVSFRNTGVDYSVNGDVDVKAVNSGVVVYAGYLDYSGYMVCIEHGYGLKSWYAHLSKTSVAAGDKVNKGDTVGVTGSSGFVGGSGVHIGLTIFDTPVCQYALWNDGSRKGIPLYTK